MVDETKITTLGVLPFFNRYPVVSYAAATGGTGGPRVIKGNPTTGLGVVDSGCRVLYGTVTPVTQYSGLPLTSAASCKKAVKFTFGGAAVGIPIFHLPYNNDQNYRVTLVDRQGIGNIDLFLTEFVDGCSIYVEGSQAAPTVYHINARSTVRVPRRLRYWTKKAKRKADWDAKYSRMDDRFNLDPINRPKAVVNALPGTIPVPTKLENRDYMEPPLLDVNALQIANRIPLQHGIHTIDGVEVLAQQGTVFGARDALTNEWSFHVQKRVLVEHLSHGVPRPLSYQWLVTSVEEFWPATTTGRIV